MADYSDLIGAAGLGAVDHYANQKPPVVKALGSNAMAVDLATLGASVFFPHVVPMKYRNYLQGASAGASYATARRLLTHFTGVTTAMDTSTDSGFEPVDEFVPEAKPEPQMAFASMDEGDNW